MNIWAIGKHIWKERVSFIIMDKGCQDSCDPSKNDIAG